VSRGFLDKKRITQNHRNSSCIRISNDSSTVLFETSVNVLRIFSNSFRSIFIRSATMSMICSNCRKEINQHALVRIYATECYDSGASRQICSVCLVGYHVPVLRPSTGKWEFGKVLSCNVSCLRNDIHQQQYQLKFTNGTIELVYVKADPFEAYAQYFDVLLDAAQSSQKNTVYQRFIYPDANGNVSPFRSTCFFVHR
jgi:hypothetical protein